MEQGFVEQEFLERMDSQLAGWSDPAGRLRQAIEKDEFALFCQPILALGADGGYPLGEVLVRMREEETALLPPGEFLPVLEHYRMMPLLDRWVVRNTLQRLASGSHLRCFSINLSAQALTDAEFSRFVAEQLKVSRVAAERLLFEIDESDVLLHPQAASRTAAALRAQGVRALVDGFGRRAVSFAMIEALDPAFVKVDGCITRKILKSEVADHKMNAILRVGEAAGFAVIAECVEDQEVLARLRSLGVGYAQGFGISKPHPIDQPAAPG